MKETFRISCHDCPSGCSEFDVKDVNGRCGITTLNEQSFDNYVFIKWSGFLKGKQGMYKNRE